MVKAVIFDLDGVIADSEKLKGEAHARTCRLFGGQVSADIYRSVMGQSGDSVMKAFLEAGSIKAGRNDYRRTFGEQYRLLLEGGVNAMPGAVELLKILAEQNWKIGLVSSSERWMIDLILKDLSVKDCFDVVVSGNDVAEHKPSPGLYMRAIELMAVKPEEVVAIEDSESGIMAANRAGIKVIALRHLLNQNHDFSQAVSVITSLEPTGDILRLLTKAEVK